MNRADPLIGLVASQQNPITDVIANSSEQRGESTATSVAEPTPRMISMAGARRPMSPVRLTLASRLGNEIDGARWPRRGLISRELPELVSVLDVRLGRVIDINVNWSSLQRQPDLNWGWWQGIHPTHNDDWWSGCAGEASDRSAPNWYGPCGNGLARGPPAYPSIRRIAIPGRSRPPNALSAWPGARECLKCGAHGEMISQ